MKNASYAYEMAQGSYSEDNAKQFKLSEDGKWEEVCYNENRDSLMSEFNNAMIEEPIDGGIKDLNKELEYLSFSPRKKRNRIKKKVKDFKQIEGNTQLIKSIKRMRHCVEKSLIKERFERLWENGNELCKIHNELNSFFIENEKFCPNNIRAFLEALYNATGHLSQELLINKISFSLENLKQQRIAIRTFLKSLKKIKFLLRKLDVEMKKKGESDGRKTIQKEWFILDSSIIPLIVDIEGSLVPLRRTVDDLTTCYAFRYINNGSFTFHH